MDPPIIKAEIDSKDDYEESNFSNSEPDIVISSRDDQNEDRKIQEPSLAAFSNRTSNRSYIIEEIEIEKTDAQPKDSSSDESVEIEPIKMFISGVEQISTPFDYIFANRSVLTIETLIEDAEGIEYISKTSCFSQVFKCVKSDTNEIKELKEKVIYMSKLHFDCKQAFHCNLLMTWYSAVTERTSFKLEARIWKRMGFSTEEPANNGLNLPGIPLILLYFLYCKEKKPEILQNFISQSLNPNSIGSVILISSIVLKAAIDVFSSKYFQREMNRKAERPLIFFLELHTRITEKWCEAFEKSQNKNNHNEILKLAKIASLS